jgi:vacuolar-type H+-ATPase subunit I/STV1
MMHLQTVGQGWESQFHSVKRDLESQSLIHSEKVTSIEREMRALIEKNNYLEEKLDTERLRTSSAERARSSAVASTNNMRKHFDFYRTYYEQQRNLHAQYHVSGP